MPRRLSDRPKRRNVFAERLKSLRESRGWSMDHLAGLAGVSQPMLTYLESGKKLPGWDTVCRIADAFGVDVGEFRK